MILMHLRRHSARIDNLVSTLISVWLKQVAAITTVIYFTTLELSKAIQQLRKIKHEARH